MSIFRKIIDRTIDAAVVVSLGVVFIVAFAQVISRFVFQLNIPWSTDVIRLAFIYTIFLGATIGVREKAHLNIGVVIDILPQGSKKIVLILVNIVVSAFLFFLIVKSTYFVMDSVGQRMPYLQVSISVLYFAILLSSIFMFYYLICQTIEQISKYKNLD